MIELARIVEYQAFLSSYRATQNEEKAVQLELLIELTKPTHLHHEWHALIATPFRYAPPHTEARFRPPYGRNIFYGSTTAETALYEHAFHFMKQRQHLTMQTETGMRTLFGVEADDRSTFYLREHSQLASIMHKNDYIPSHQFISAHPKIDFIIYPSCRDPQQRDNAAVFAIQYLAKEIKREMSINFFYDNEAKKMTWINYKMHINWQDVC